MKVRTFNCWSDKNLDDRVNQFLSNENIEVLEIQFSTTIFTFNAMIIYK